MRHDRKRRPIEGFPDYYITSDGLIWSKKSKRFLRGYHDKKGRHLVDLFRDKAEYRRSVKIIYRKAFPEMLIPACSADHELNDLVEAWVIIEEFPDYAISNHGRVRSERTGRLLRINVGRGDHTSVGLMGLEPTNVRRSITRLVADYFMEPPPHAAFDTPIHLNGDIKDCHLYNLMWRPRWFAVKFHQQFRTGFHIPDQIADRETGIVYDNPTHAAQVHGLLISEIVQSMAHEHECWPTRQVFELV